MTRIENEVGAERSPTSSEIGEEKLANGLVWLTEKAMSIFPFDQGYALGGPCGYGFTYENDTFSMHRYCWCDREDCPWCGEQNAPNFLHKPSGYSVWWYKWIGRGMTMKGECDDLRAALMECRQSMQADKEAGRELKENEW